MKDLQTQSNLKSVPSTGAIQRVLLYRIGKRIIDISGSLALLLMFMPILIGCGIWIKSRDGGSIFYKQWRVGRNGWLFRIYKFRTMSLNAESKGIQLAKNNDPRVLRGCHWMRKSHIDELPQLINILFGNMSLVGPRPERPEIFEELRGDLPSFSRRLAAKPGLTGLAQVLNGYSNDLTGMRMKLAYDLQYLRKRSVLGDLKLIFLTIPKFWDNTAC
ncbi:UDP-N-acetylgalactosamine-undecaprenyl-phosphate N-acetylgalactosaminephosphotransferase [Poriferisphaera corsica]|uniref:UDP-N-acetylgalactosamine-undecaprenyl-phosphate N-acetylgalactosaminephosphotransferase n=1 Tax=Poriferisphaera corsica TaxID=2528020 RepID=A0A517YUW1_9BACT|nr:sugar transferase [Poriferisphaera corsica]QDU34001.1 UDP-N-acetylgalactosamine-undecaprenyl-phosphate N-acetylgalactosaminephosphotransferase [Poriferisphaera corsica]